MACFLREFHYQLIGNQGEVAEVFAGFAAEMSVLRKSGIEAVSAPGGFQPLNFAGIHQNIQITVYRSEADTGILFPDEQMYVFS